jgi:hypothetical protein
MPACIAIENNVAYGVSSEDFGRIAPEWRLADSETFVAFRTGVALERVLVTDGHRGTPSPG